MQRVLVFGNPLIERDSIALRVAEGLKREVKGVRFEVIAEPDEVKKWKNVVILDAVQGLKEVKEISMRKLFQRKIFSLHDFDLGFYLLLQKKIGKIKEKDVRIIGIPIGMNELKAKEKVKKILNASTQKK